MRYPLLFPFGEEGWHPLIPLDGIDLADNPDLHARRRTHINLDSDDDDDEQDALRLGRGGSKRVTQSEHYAFALQNREGIFSPLLHAGRLCQEFSVDAWVCVEANRLNYARVNQA